MDLEALEVSKRSALLGSDRLLVGSELLDLLADVVLGVVLEEGRGLHRARNSEVDGGESSPLGGNNLTLEVLTIDEELEVVGE